MEELLRSHLIHAAALKGRAIHRSNLPLVHGGKMGHVCVVVDGRVLKWLDGNNWISLREATPEDYRQHYVCFDG